MTHVPRENVPGVFQYLSESLYATGDPLDAERARLIGFMLVSRGADVPFPTLLDPHTAATNDVFDDAVQQRTDESFEPAAAKTPEGLVAPAANGVSQHDESNRLVVSSTHVYDHMRDGLIARFATTHELAVFPGQTLSVGEEYAEERQREVVKAETSAYRFVCDMVKGCIEPSDLIRNEDMPYVIDWIRATNLTRMKQLLSSMIFENVHGSLETRKNLARVVVGVKELGSEPGFKRVLYKSIANDTIGSHRCTCRRCRCLSALTAVIGGNGNTTRSSPKSHAK